MKVSIITATYNSENVIEDCLSSVFNQNYHNIESIVIDGNSSDQTISIVKKLKKNHHDIKILSESDSGIYDALNKGIALSEGEIIGFLHSDDILKSNRIIDEIVKMIKSKNLDGIYGNLHYVDKYDITKVIRNWKSSDFNHDLLKKGWMPPHPTLFLKKNVYDRHGYFNLSYSISADYDFILRIFKDTELKFGFLPKVITAMRIGGKSNRSLKNMITKTIEDYRVISNNSTGNIMTLLRKNISKIEQFF